MYQYLRLSAAKFEDKAAYLKERASLRNDLLADGADLLRVAPNTGYVPFMMKANFAAQPAFAGWGGCLVGYLGARKVWLKLKKK